MYARIVKNASLLWFAKIVSVLLSLFISARLARYLGVEGYGLYGYIYSLSNLLLIPTNLKIGTTLVRELSRQEGKEEHSRILGAGVSARMMLSVIGILVVVVFAVIGDYSSEVAWSLVISSLSFVCLFSTQIFLSVFRSAEKMEYELGISILNTSLYAILVALVTWLDLGIVSVFASKLVAEFVPLMSVVYIVVTRFRAPMFRKVGRLRLDILRMSVPFGVSLIVKEAYLRLGPVLLKVLAGKASVGLLRPASQLYENLGMFPLFAAIAVYPFLSKEARAADKAYFFKRYGELFKYFLVSALGLSLGVLAAGDWLINLIFGREFAASGLPLRILTWAIPCMFLNQLLGHLLSSIDRQGKEALNYVIGMLAFLGMIFALVPAMTYVGVAAAMAISETLLFALNYYSVSRAIGQISMGTVIRPVLSAAIAAAVLFVVSDGVYWLIAVAAAELVYFAALLITGTFPKRKITAFAGEIHRLSVFLLKR